MTAYVGPGFSRIAVRRSAASKRRDDMICKVCGTEIADKALICYRCGTSTFEPTRRDRKTTRRRSSPYVTVIALIVLALAGVFATTGIVAGVIAHTIALVVLVLAALVVALQLLLRRRR